MKTTASMLRLGRHAFEQRPFEGVARTRFAIVRNTGPQLVDTTMKSWFKLFPSDGKYRKWTSTSKTQVWHFHPKGYRYPIHAEFVFRPLDTEDDVDNLLSLEVTGFYFNELREINTKILAHAGRRAGRYPGADLGGCTWRGWVGDTNPWAATSDLHDMFVASPRDGYKFFKQPGGMEENAENLENLEQTSETLRLSWDDPRRRAQGRTYYINALRDYNKSDADMFVHCKYGASKTGKPVYESYDDNAHCKSFELLVDRTPVRRKDMRWERREDGTLLGIEEWYVSTERVPIKIGYDNTGRNPAALIAQRTDTGQWRWRYEFIGQGMGMRQHAEELAKFLAEKIPNYYIEKITCDPAGAAKGADDLDMRMIIQKQFPGVLVLNARTNDPATRIDAVESTLRRMINGEPAVWIHPDCKILRSACISKYQYRKLKMAGEERYTENPDKISPYADIADAAQYLHLGGGEGRVNSNDNPTGKEPNWPKDGKAITPQLPKDAVRRESRIFDPRNGSFFDER